MFTKRGFVIPVLLIALTVIFGLSIFFIFHFSGTGRGNVRTIEEGLKEATPQPLIDDQEDKRSDSLDVKISDLPSLNIDDNAPGKQIGKGEARIELAYPNRTNLADPNIKSRVEKDILFVQQTIGNLPVLGFPMISISAQDRYGYDFPAVNRESLGTYTKAINQLFLNMEMGPSITIEHLILHELAGHYLSIRQNVANLSNFIDLNSANLALLEEVKLINEIRRYNKDISQNADLALEEKFRLKQPVSLQDIIEASNVYPAEIWNNPKDFLQFRQEGQLDLKTVQFRSDSELYAEFTSFLLRAQKLELFDRNYKHPVLEVFESVRKKIR